MTFKASATSKRKDNSPQARLPWRPAVVICFKASCHRFDPMGVPHEPVSESWPEFPFPHCRVSDSDKVFEALPAPRPFQGGLPRGLGPTDPCPNTVSTETYSASVFCVLKQNNRYYHQDLHWEYTIARRLTPNASSRAPRPPTRSWIIVFTRKPAYHR